MEEKRIYIVPTIDSIPISVTENLGSGACEPEGSVPPPVCGAVAPSAVGDPQS